MIQSELARQKLNGRHRPLFCVNDVNLFEENVNVIYIYKYKHRTFIIH